MKQLFTAKDGQTKNLDKALEAVRAFVLNGLHERWQAYTIEIKKKRKAARYKEYFGYVVEPIFKSKILDVQPVHGDVIWNLTRENVHQYLKLVYCGIEIVDKTTGEMHTIARSTTELDDYKFIGLYMEKIRADFAQRGVVFPEKPEREELAPWNDNNFLMMLND